MVHKLQDERQREAGAERAAELSTVKEELAKLKEQRNQAEVLMQGIVRQRDMYKALAQARVRLLFFFNLSYSSSLYYYCCCCFIFLLHLILHLQDQETVSMQPVLQAEPPTDSNRLLRELQDEFDRYRRERAENDRLFNERVLACS